MGQNRIELLQCEEPITTGQLLDMLNNANQHSNNILQDVLQEGVLNATIEPSESGIGITIEDFECYSSSGHGKQVSQYEIDLSSYVPGSGYRYISIFATPGWESGDNRANAYGVNEYHKRTETVSFSVVQGSPSLPPSNPGGGAVRVCTIRLHHSTTSISSSMIRTALSNSDHLKPLTGKLDKTGGTLSGTVTYNGKALSQTNQGSFKFQTEPQKINLPTQPDYHNHYILTSGGYIDTGIVSEALTVDLIPVINFYAPSGSVGLARISPHLLRFHTDIASTLSELLVAIYEEDVNGKNTGKFLVVCVGSLHFCERFAGKTVRWFASAPQPNGLEL